MTHIDSFLDYLRKREPMNRAKRTFGRLSQRDVLRLFKTGQYRADLQTGTIYGKNGQALIPFSGQRQEDRLFIRLYEGNRRVAIGLGRAIWIAATGHTIPRGFEVHHKNEVRADYAFENLICLHKLDHRKFHDMQPVEDEVPF